MDLNNLLEEHGMTIYELAKRTDISQTYLHKIAKGNTTWYGVTYGRLVRIASVFGLSVDELVNGK